MKWWMRNVPAVLAPVDDRHHFSEFLKIAQVTYGISNFQMAYFLRINENYYSYLKNGRIVPFWDKRILFRHRLFKGLKLWEFKHGKRL